jgi:hypothetical protein
MDPNAPGRPPETETLFSALKAEHDRLRLLIQDRERVSGAARESLPDVRLVLKRDRRASPRFSLEG